MSITLLHSTIFGGADTSLGAAGTTTGLGDGNIDLFGNALNIQSGQAINHRGGSDYLQNFGARPTSENVQNEEAVFGFVYTGTSDHAMVGVRYDAGTGVAWAARYDSGTLVIFNTAGAGWTDHTSVPCTLTVGNTYYISCGAQSADSTHSNITAGIYNDSAMTSAVAVSTWSNTTIAPQSAGQFIFGGWTSAAPGVSFTTYDLGPVTPVPGIAAASAIDQASIGLASTVATAGTPGYTYQWYGSTSGPSFTPSSATALTGATGLTFTHTGLVAGQRWFYICRATDTNAQTADTPVCSATTYKRSFQIAMLGDSLTAGATGDTAPNIGTLIGARLAAIDGPNLVTIVNAAVGGTRIEFWLPTAAPQAGQSTNLWTQLTTGITSAGGVTHCLICIGANNADTTGQVQYTTWLSTIIAALSALGIKAILDDVTPPLPDGTAVTAQHNARILGFNAALDTLVDNLWTFRGAKSLYAFAENHPSNFEDPVHPDATARGDWSTIRAAAAFNVIVPQTRSVCLSTGTFQIA